MVLPSEGFAAYVARVRALVGVRPLVDQQVVALGELSAAEPTNKLFLGPGRPASPWYTRVHRDRGVLRGRGGGRRRGRRGAGRGGRRGRRRDARGRDSRGRRRRRRRRARAIIPLGYSSQEQLVVAGRRAARPGCFARQEFRGQQGQRQIVVGHKLESRLVVLGRAEQLIHRRRLVLDGRRRRRRRGQDTRRRRAPLTGRRRRGSRDAGSRAARMKTMKRQVRLQRLQVQGGRGGVSRWQKSRALQRGEEGDALETQGDALEREIGQLGAARREAVDLGDVLVGLARIRRERGRRGRRRGRGR